MELENQESKAPNPRGGPRTEEGKNRPVSMPSVTASPVEPPSSPGKENANYEQLRRRMQEHYQPVGPMEEYYVQAIADGIWKQNRGNDAESCLMALYLHKHLGVLETTGSPELDQAVIKGMMYAESWQKLASLSRCAQRVENQVRESLEKLEELQGKRKRAEEEALLEAAVLKQEHEKRPENKKIAYNPGDDGFVLTLEEVDHWLRRQERRRAAGLPMRTLPTAPEIYEKRRMAA